MRSDVLQRSSRISAAIVIAGGLALLGGALAFEHIGGLVPCEMCIWQRQAIAAALVFATLALVLKSRAVAALAAIAMLGNAAIGGFHAGVEQKWWDGITRCATTPSSGSTADIIGDILATPLVRCDAIPWSLFGVSMAGWNFIIASIIGALALWRLKA